MLERLDDVFWADLHHAYGSAEDVPVLIRFLRSADPDERSEARFELYGNIYHQGSRYEASPYAVPFLVELAVDPGTPERHQLLEMLALLAIGFADLPDRFAIDTLRREVYGRRPGSREELATYEAVAAAIPALARLVADDDPEVASAAAFTLAWFPEQAAQTGPALGAAADDPGRPSSVRQSALLALGLTAGSGVSTYDALLDHALADDDSNVRWAAAGASAMLHGASAPESALRTLREWAAEYSRDTEDVQPWRIDRPTLALRLLDRHDPATAGRIRVAVVRARLAAPMTSNWHNHVLGAANTAYPEGHPKERVPFEQLSPAQQEFVRILARRGEMFRRPGNTPGMVLGWYHLPKTRWGLAWYARRKPP